MPSASDQIMSAIKAALIAGGTVAASRVFVDRVDPLQAHELPAILIDDRGDSCEILDLSGLHQRTTTLVIHCTTSHATAAAPSARAFGLAVEKIIAADEAVNNLAQLGIDLIAAQTDPDGSVDRLFATRSQTWQASYTVHPSAPDILNP